MAKEASELKAPPSPGASEVRSSPVLLRFRGSSLQAHLGSVAGGQMAQDGARGPPREVRFPQPSTGAGRLHTRTRI